MKKDKEWLKGLEEIDRFRLAEIGRMSLKEFSEVYHV